MPNDKVRKTFKDLQKLSVGVSDDERMQSRDERRSRGECRRGDAETRGRAEAGTKPEEQREKSSAESRAEAQWRSGETRRKGAEVQRRKGAEVQRHKCAKRLKTGSSVRTKKEKTLAGTLAENAPI